MQGWQVQWKIALTRIADDQRLHADGVVGNFDGELIVELYMLLLLMLLLQCGGEVLQVIGVAQLRMVQLIGIMMWLHD